MGIEIVEEKKKSFLTNVKQFFFSKQIEDVSEKNDPFLASLVG